ncbi:MFS transporter [Natronomonas amylolytica]|uniref:MFS transporter n=1 Tax=Natronomonas amylolytica TaxID=3108498 RepID=UPI0030085614
MDLVERLFGANAGMVSDRDFRLLLAASATGALGTALVSPILDSLTGPFGVSPSVIGLMVTAVSAPAVVLIPVLGYVTDRLGRKPVIVGGLLCFGTGGVAIAFTTDFRLVLSLRVLQGIGFSGIIPVIITVLGDRYADNDEATAQGLRFATSGVSQAVFPAIAGIVIAFTWQFPFLLYGLAIPVAVAVAVTLEDVPGRTNRLNALSDSGYLGRLRRLAMRRKVLAYVLARGIVVLPFVAFLTYNSIIVVSLQDGTVRLAGLYVALFSVVYAMAATQVGRVVSTFDRTAVPLITANLLLGGGLVAFAMAGSSSTALTAVFMMGIGVGFALSLYRTIITGLAPRELRGGLVSLTESFGRLIGTLTPLAIGFVLSRFEPAIGFDVALRGVVIVAGLLSVVVGTASVLVARVSAVPTQTT